MRRDGRPPQPHAPRRHGPSTFRPPETEREAPPKGGRGAGHAGDWLYGRHAVGAALLNPRRTIHRLLATPEAAAELADHAQIAATGIAAEPTDRDTLARLLPPGAVHQGLALSAAPLPPVALEDMLDALDEEATATRAVLLFLDQVTDPQNIGAILRSAAVFGARAVVVPERHAPPITGAMAKAASGAVEHVPLVRVINLARSLDAVKEAGFWCIGLDGGAERTLAAVWGEVGAQVGAPSERGGRSALVLGAEGEGLRRLTREHCDVMARLPTPGPLTSLNVSVATAVALYEVARTSG